MFGFLGIFVNLYPKNMSALKINLSKFKSKYLDPRLILLMDTFVSLCVSIVVVIVAYLLGSRAVQSREFMLIWGCSSVLSSVLMFLLLRTHSIIIRHFTFKDTLIFAFAMAGKVVLMCLVVLLWPGQAVSTSVSFMLMADFLVSVCALCVIRLFMIIVYDAYKSNIRELQKCKRVLVYGLNDKSLSILTRLRNSNHYDILGFITSDQTAKNTTFADKNVYTFTDKEDFDSLVSQLSLSGIIFTRDSDAQSEQSGLIKYCTDLGLKIMIVPTIDEMGENGTFHIREVKIEDLLGREEIKISLEEIRKNISGKVVMVTGAAGSIGSELCHQLAGFGVKKLVLFDNAETPMHNLRLELEEKFPTLSFVPVIGDVRLEARLDFAFRSHHPQIVFHAAAYKHVPLMEENPCEAVLVNVIGSRNVANKCIEYDVEKMVMISTDKAVNPTNVMGCTKRLAEIYVQSLGQAIAAGKVQGRTKFVTTRFGNVLGSNGSVIPRFREQIAKGGPVTVTHPDITRFFMTIPEACRLVMEAATMPTENRICVFDMGTPVKIDTLARRMIELSGYEPDKEIRIEYTGLRPGEKLYEEVLSNVENTDPTSHDRIRIARVREYDYNDAVKYAAELERLSREVLIPETVILMKEIVPEYISNNSKYQVYDKR